MSDQVSFASAENYAAGKVPYDVTSADFDGDGKQDLAVADDGGTFTDGSVQVLFNEGSGTFGDPTSYDDFTDTPRGITSADYNKDGEPDLAVTNSGEATATVLLNQGQADLQLSFLVYEVGADYPEGITSADLNGDGRPDLATANSGSSFGASNASVLLNTTELTETGRCTITGTGRDDVLKGTGGQDIICGRGGDDRIKGGRGDDEILGGRGDDAINGGAGNDVLRGGRGEDRMVGGGGSDVLYGGLGVDRCARGNDRETGCEKP